jgi:putative intracellular protease/amidase
MSQTTTIVIYLYDGVTALDAIGPYEVLRFLPSAEVKFVAKEKGVVQTDSGRLRLMADYAMNEVNHADIVVLPGGTTTMKQMENPDVIAWVKSLHQTTRWTTSVCDGSGILYAADLLENIPCTAHWASVDWLKEKGINAVRERVVEAGKIISAGGVSSGIDMALRLVMLESGEDLAKAIQLALEYDPAPPVDSGSFHKATPETIQQSRDLLMANMKRARTDERE